MVIIRRATADDAEQLCSVHVRSIRKLCSPHYSAEQIEAWSGGKKPDGYVRAMEAGEVMFVACETEKVVGLGGFIPAKCEISALYIDPDYFRTGLGVQLLSTLEDYARGLGTSELHLSSSIGAVSFYEKYGYHAGAQCFHTLSSGVRVECIPMKKEL